MNSLPVGVALALACGSIHGASGGGGGLPRSSPEAEGVASGALVGFVQALDERVEGMHSVMVVRHGRVIAEGWWSPYTAERRHSLYSLSKSFTSTAVGMAVAEGRLSVDDPVLGFFPDAAPAEPDGNLNSMRVSDLLRMSAGHHSEVSLNGETQWVRAFLAQPVVHKPGTFFLYNTPATYMLSAIVQKTTGVTVLEYLRPRLFEPLGIADPVWDQSPEGVTLGGYGLSVRTEDIAKLGQLYLQKGAWGGKQLLPAAWAEAATSRQTSNGSNPNSDWDQGYGYQFWRCRNGAYRGDGAFGQYCIVMPEQDAVVAITSGVKNMQSVLDIVWERLLPAMQAKRLKNNRPGQAALKSLLEGLRVPVQVGAVTSPWASKVTGRRYVLPGNADRMEAAGLDVNGEGDVTLVVRAEGLESRLLCGRGVWKEGRVSLGRLPEQAIAASGAWVAEDTFEAKVCLVETPFHIHVKLRFAGDEVRYDTEYSVGFGPTQRPTLTGVAAK